MARSDASSGSVPLALASFRTFWMSIPSSLKFPIASLELIFCRMLLKLVAASEASPAPRRTICKAAAIWARPLSPDMPLELASAVMEGRYCAMSRSSKPPALPAAAMMSKDLPKLSAATPRFDMAAKPAFDRSSRLAPVAVAALAMDGMAFVARSTSRPMPTRKSCAFTMSVANWFICDEVAFAASPMPRSCSDVRLPLAPISASALSNSWAACTGAVKALFST